MPPNTVTGFREQVFDITGQLGNLWLQRTSLLHAKTIQDLDMALQRLALSIDVLKWCVTRLRYKLRQS